MADHTPGPWDISKIGTVHKNGVLHPIRPDETRLAGESWIDMRHRIAPELEARKRECEANARLIASAPDMASRISELEAERDRLREALEPFANALVVYGEFPEHQLILLSEDNPKGRRLAHLLPENFDAARAALGDSEGQSCSTCRYFEATGFCRMYELPRQDARDQCEGTYHQPREATHD